jgi:NAD(P)-dependent dehydrogenase (short-subunit alcohol dehydrogenase family)
MDRASRLGRLSSHQSAHRRAAYDPQDSNARPSHSLPKTSVCDPTAAGAAPAPRILSVASVASYLPTAKVQIDDLQRGTPGSYGACTTPVDCFAYHQSKNAQLLFSRELQRRLGGKQSRATALSLHPGLVVTPVLFGGAWEAAGHLFRFARVTPETTDGGGAAANERLREMGPERARRLQLLTGLKTPAQGAQTSIWAATAPEICAADYGGRFVREVADAEAEARLVAPGYGDDALGRELWRRAEALSGTQFDPRPML